MIGFLARRMGHAVLVLFVVSIIAFSLSNMIGDPVASILGLNSTPAKPSSSPGRIFATTLPGSQPIGNSRLAPGP